MVAGAGPRPKELVTRKGAAALVDSHSRLSGEFHHSEHYPDDMLYTPWRGPGRQLVDSPRRVSPLRTLPNMLYTMVHHGAALVDSQESFTTPNITQHALYPYTDAHEAGEVCTHGKGVKPKRFGGHDMERYDDTHDSKRYSRASAQQANLRRIL